jgi:hypothetical protein
MQLHDFTKLQAQMSGTAALIIACRAALGEGRTGFVNVFTGCKMLREQ